MNEQTKIAKVRITEAPKKKEFWKQSKISQEKREEIKEYREKNLDCTYSELAFLFDTTIDIISYAINHEKRKERARIAQAERRKLGLIDKDKKRESRKKRREEKLQNPEMIEVKDAVWYEQHKTYHNNYMAIYRKNS